jgi:hypothetical protein
LVGVAQNVVLLDGQIDGLDGVILTVGVKYGLTIIVIALDKAVVELGQFTLLVITHVIISLLLRDVLEYVVPVPTFAPFFFH